MHCSKSMDRLSLLLSTQMTPEYESSVTKFSVIHKYDLFRSKKQYLGWIMHVRHIYDSFRSCSEIRTHRSEFFIFCVGVLVKFQKFLFHWILNKISNLLICISCMFYFYNLYYRRCSKNRTFAITLEWQVRYAWNSRSTLILIRVFHKII